MFRNITEVKAANKALGHFWFVGMRQAQQRIESRVIDGRYWIESCPSIMRPGERDFQAIETDETGHVRWLAGAARFHTKAEARRVIADMQKIRKA